MTTAVGALAERRPGGPSRSCHGPTYAGSSYISKEACSVWKSTVYDD